MAKKLHIRGLQSGLGTLTVKMFRAEDHASFTDGTRDTQVNGAAETAAEETNLKGQYRSTTISDGGGGDLTGPHIAMLETSGGVPLGHAYPDMSDDEPIVAFANQSVVGAVRGSSLAAKNNKDAAEAIRRGAVQTAEAAANTNIAFDTDLPLENDDYYGDGDGGLVIAFISGTAQQFQTRRIVASATGTNNTRVTLEAALDGVPADDDQFICLGRITELS